MQNSTDPFSDARGANLTQRFQNFQPRRKWWKAPAVFAEFECL